MSALAALERARAAAPELVRSPGDIVRELDESFPARDGRAHERRRILRELLVELERARESRAEWYVWIADVYSKGLAA